MNLNPTEYARFNMIHQQIRPWNVNDNRVLTILSQLPREEFVPETYRGAAFADTQIPLDNGHSMMEPKLVGRLLQTLAIQPKDNILEIGTGSGYLTACLAKLGGYVTSVDIDEETIETAEKHLGKQGIRNVSLKVVDALAGLPGGAYDIIVVTGSLPHRNIRFESALTLGGRMFAVLGQSPLMEACLITRLGDEQWRCDSLFETELAPLENTVHAKAFVF